MFIDQGTPVDVVKGPFAGRFGVVSKIRIYQDAVRGLVDVMVFCELFNFQSGVFDTLAVEAGDIKRRRLTPQQTEQLLIDSMRAAA